jgi:hypothetical protein
MGKMSNPGRPRGRAVAPAIIVAGPWTAGAAEKSTSGMAAEHADHNNVNRPPRHHHQSTRMRSRHRWLLGLAAIAAAGGGGGAAAQQQQGGGCCACSGNNGSGTRGGTAMTEFRLGALFPMFRRAAGAANGMLDVGGAQVRCLAHVCRLLLPLPPPPPRWLLPLRLLLLPAGTHASTHCVAAIISRCSSRSEYPSRLSS